MGRDARKARAFDTTLRQEKGHNTREIFVIYLRVRHTLGKLNGARIRTVQSL